MNFKTKRINKKETINIPKPRKFGFFSKKHITIQFPILATIIILLFLFIGTVKAITSIDFKVFLKIAGDELQADGYGHTNFLLLGTGDKEHEGGNLTDSIIVASLDNENKLITMISIPRDLWVKDSQIGNSRINEIYYSSKIYFGSETEGIEHMKEKVELIMGIPIHYWVKVDFTGFKELIDALDGIDIYVDTPIYDPSYPKDGTFLYETFNLPAGQHHMDGETALKYARSRKTTSDFDRASRQQEILYAIKEKALKTNLIFDKEKISNILITLKNNIETNITVKEILTLGGMAGDYSQEQILHKLIHDDPTICGGFLYTPMREYYNDQFVLVPAGGAEFIHLYSDLMFNMPQIGVEGSKIHILNGTKSAGVAGEAKQILQRFCFDIIRFGNAKNKEITETTYYYPIDSRPEALNFLQKLIPGKESTEIPQEYLEEGYLIKANIVLEIGSDYVNSENYIDDPFYYIFLQTPTENADQ